MKKKPSYLLERMISHLFNITIFVLLILGATVFSMLLSHPVEMLQILMGRS